MSEAHQTAVEIFLQLAGVSFTSRDLLRQALTHRSFAHENGMDPTRGNEELEFLGDAVLGFFAVERFFQLARQRDLNVGSVAKLKSWVVSEEVLAECARGLKLPACLLLGRGEHASGGRLRMALLADALEAVIGAYYLDQGVERARVFVMRLLAPYIERSMTSGQCFDCKSLLQSYVQREFGELPRYEVVAMDGIEHQKSFVVEVSFDQRCWGSGKGRNKKQAEKAAARGVCEKLGLTDETL